jgi:drug/metabolite transporter (DMT)-like permease
MSAPALAVPASARTLAGIGWVLLGYAAFSLSDATIKALSGGYPVAQIAVVMALVVLPLVLAHALAEGGPHTLVPQRPGLVALRGVLVATCALSAWQAFALLPLAEAYAITFAAPILVTVLAALVLGEAIGWRRWSAVAVGFLGVLIMIRPGFQVLGTGHFYALVCTLAGSLAVIILRLIGDRERSPAIFATTLLAVLVAALPLALADWRPVASGDLAVMALAGLLQAAGHAAVLRAIRAASPGVLAPFQYSQMLWAVACGVLIFGDRVDPWLLAGMAVVVASGLYTLHRERVRRSVGDVRIFTVR